MLKLNPLQAKNPEPADWDRVLAYADRVHSITYVEAINNVAPSVFPIFEDFRPRDFILPNLTSLTWKAETPIGLERSLAYITPDLQSLTIEMGTKYPRMGDFLDKVISRTQLASFSFTLHSNMPDNFVDILRPNKGLEKLSLMAPGALSARVGQWTAGLPCLRSFALDLSNRTTTAIEGFFEDIATGSGYSTPSSVGGTDSGVFSGDEFDFSEIRKSAVRLTSDGPRYGAFANLQQISLTGDTANVATFLKHITSPLSSIDLFIEDPPAKEDWQDLCNLVSDQFSHSLQSLRIGATSASRFNELVRATSRGGEVNLQHLSLEHFAFLPLLVRFEIDLPESVIFENRDVTHLARVCPSLEVVRLCPSAKFPPATGPPYLTLEGIVPLTTECRRLHTLAIVALALEGSDETFLNLECSSQSLLRLHVGHSWIRDPLHTALLLSHIAPNLETVKWFSQATRAGSVEPHAAAWQKVSEFLPSLQRMRRIERSLKPIPKVHIPPPKVDRGIQAVVSTSSRGISASPSYVDCETQAMPTVVEVEIDAVPHTCSIEIDATPMLVNEEIMAVPVLTETAVDARPEFEEKSIETEIQTEDLESTSPHPPMLPIFSAVMPSLSGVASLPLKAVFIYTWYLTLPFRYMLSVASAMHSISDTSESYENEPKTPVPGALDDDETDIYISEKPMPSMNTTMPTNMPSMSTSVIHDSPPENHLRADISVVCQ